jgi:hypothetical protein
MVLRVDQEPGASLRHRAWALARRLGRIALYVGAGLYLAYLAAINLFLSTRLFDVVVNASPTTLQVRYERGWSMWPGRIHARGLSIRSVDSNVEWILRLDGVRFDVSLLALAKRRFEASNVHGAGISYRLRTRMNAWDVTPARLEGLPPIEGLWEPPVRPYEQCSADEWSDADYHLITVKLSDVHAENVRELWINRYQLKGGTNIAGGFYLKPLREVAVGPIQTSLRDGLLLVKDEPWAGGLGGRTDLTVAKFDPRVASGTDILRGVALDVDVNGQVQDLGRWPLPLPEDVRAHGAVDVRRLAVRFEHGALLPGSRVEAVAPALVLERNPYRITTALSVEEHGVDDRRVVVNAVAGSARFEREGEALVVAPRIDASAEAGPIAIDHGIEEPHATVFSDDVEVPDVRAFASVLPEDAKITLGGGRARAEFRAEAWPDDSRATGRASMQAEDLDVTAGGVRVRGGASAKASVASFDWRTKRLEKPDASAQIGLRVQTLPTAGADGNPSSTSFAGDVRAILLARDLDQHDGTLDMSGSGVALRNVSIAGAPPGDSRGDVRLQNATLKLENPHLEGILSADVTDATALLEGLRSAVPVMFRGLLNIPRLLASARLTMTGERVALREVQAHGGSLVVHGLYEAQPKDHLGAFVVDGGPVSVGIRLDPEGTHVRLFGLGSWLDDQEADANKRLGAPTRPTAPASR